MVNICELIQISLKSIIGACYAFFVHPEPGICIPFIGVKSEFFACCIMYFIGFEINNLSMTFFLSYNKCTRLILLLTKYWTYGSPHHPTVVTTLLGDVHCVVLYMPLVN